MSDISTAITEEVMAKLCECMRDHKHSDRFLVAGAFAPDESGVDVYYIPEGIAVPTEPYHNINFDEYVTIGMLTICQNVELSIYDDNASIPIGSLGLWWERIVELSDPNLHILLSEWYYELANVFRQLLFRDGF